MTDRFARTYMLLGASAMEQLKKANVLLFGIGGVGGYAAETLIRSGVGSITLVDNDTVSISNINRQIIATDATIGQKKTEVMKQRILSINPDCRVKTHDLFYLPGTEGIITNEYDYILDAVDTVSAKLDIVMQAHALQIPVISCMGTGNKLAPELLQIDDIYNTSVCPLCRVMRYELKKRGCKGLPVVYSKEVPQKPNTDFSDATNGRTPGSTSFVPPVAGLLMASRVIRDLLSLQ